MKKNNKGFTLIELLAVIVVLAIIMVIATQQINRTISRTRANSMIKSLEMAAKGVKTKMADGSMATCETGCLKDVIDYNETEEYNISVDAKDNNWVITLEAKTGSEFETADFTEIGDYANGKVGKIKVDNPKKASSDDGVVLPKISCTVNGETGAIE